MRTSIVGIILVVFIGVLAVPDSEAGSRETSGSTFTKDLWKSPRPMLKRTPKGPMVYKQSDSSQDPVYNIIADGVFGNRSLIGGGRKIIRHDCVGEDPSSLEVVFLRDIGYTSPVLYDALSSDNGVFWSSARPDTSVANEAGADLDPVIDFSENFLSEEVTYLVYTEETAAPGDSSPVRWTSDLFKCLQAYNPFGVIGWDDYLTMLSMNPFGEIYMSYIDFYGGDPYNTFFKYSTDHGMSWSVEIKVSENFGTNGFAMRGMDGPLMLDSDGNYIAALAMVLLDDTWAETNGFLRNVTYPAYTISTDGGQFWTDLRLVFGNNGSAYPRGHSHNVAFDDSIHYIGGVEDAGFTAYNSCQDNVVITSDGVAHMTFTMRDTTFGYSGLWHVTVEHPEVRYKYVGYPEDPALSGESGVAFMPSIARSVEDYIGIGWTEFIQPDNLGDICAFMALSGELDGQRLNVTRTPAADEVYQRFVDLIVPIQSPHHYFDWIFMYYDPASGNSLDSTLWHLQYEFYFHWPGIEEYVPEGPGIPKTAVLNQNYPNPFNPVTSIEYSVDRRQVVVLEIMNLRGQFVRTLVSQIREPGRYRVTWDGRNDSGMVVPTGMYFCRFHTEEGTTLTRKMVLLK